MAHPIGRWFESLRRDLRFAAGARTPPFTPRLRRPDTGTLPTRRLVVREVVRETPDAVTLWLEDPKGAPIAFEAGQFFTLLVDVGGDVLRRAYSASSSPRDGTKVGLTVKRVAGGRASTHLVELARAGDAFEVLGPSGSFTLAAAGDAASQLVLVAGGSGITPLFSILREVLETDPARKVALVHANRTAHDVIFARALDELAARYPARFFLRSVFGKTLEPGAFTAALDALPFAEGAEYYVCGPEPMMHLVRDALRARGVAADRLHEERFISPQAKVTRAAIARGPVRVTVRVAGKEHGVEVLPGRTLLEAGLAAKVPMPFSCALGGCGACRVKVHSGTVEMDEPTCLTDAERAEGYALACVGRPSDGAVVEST
jgi:ring-1,2-phenylacetyl-CoA epoxidase subunit PaaE